MSFLWFMCICLSVQLPPICSYQTGHYVVTLQGYSLSSDMVLLESDFDSSSTQQPVDLTIGAGLDLNQTYSIEVVVSNSEGESRQTHTFSKPRSLSNHPQL